MTGRVVDAATQQPLAGAAVAVAGRGGTTSTDGRYTLSGVAAGSQTLRVTHVGYGEITQTVTVAAGQTTTVNVQMAQQALQLQELVAVGYGTQKRGAITGAVSTVKADEADVGVVSDANHMIQGRVAGVQIVTNSGEPGAGAQIRIRGGTSISASNEPLYVIDGVPIDNTPTEPGGMGIGGGAPLPRSPLALLNPADIQSITILKDAAATAIYGSRGANGVVLIQTKRGATGGITMEYDGYVAMATPARRLDVLDGAQYRKFVQDQVAAGNLDSDRLASLGPANTNWEKAVTRTAYTQNHNLAFSGGTGSTVYRASLNYMNQQGVVLNNGFERIQGRLNASSTALSDRLTLELNLTSSHITNDYLPDQNTGGFEGGVFNNMVVFNPTEPVKVQDSTTGQMVFYEVGAGSQSLRNPVALTEQIVDQGNTTRTLGNASAELLLVPGLTATVNVGADRSDGGRGTYWPRISPVGAQYSGLAQQNARNSTTLTLQTLLTGHRDFGVQTIDVVGGYEFTRFSQQEFGSQAQGFTTDAFDYYNLGGGSQLVAPYSWRNDSRLVSFFGRANYNYGNRYYLTGVLRRDGSSRFGAGNKWALFPAASAAWRISEEPFMKRLGLPFSDLRIRAGYGLQGNPGVPPYASLIILAPEAGARYPFGDQITVGYIPTQDPNPNLKWEQTAQFDAGIDFGLLDNMLSGTLEYYVKNTSDLLLSVAVPQPALVDTRLENIGKLRNAGIEASLDALVLERANASATLGLVFSADRNKVVDLGGRGFITTGNVSGQGQSGQVSERIMPGQPLGTFYGARFSHVAAEANVVGGDTIWHKGQQLFVCNRTDASCVNGLTGAPTADDYAILGNANPDFTLGLTGQGKMGAFDLSFLIRSEVGGKVFNNTALVYSTKGNVLQNKNFLVAALNDPTGLHEPAIFSSRWIEDRTFTRLQNVTLGYSFDLPGRASASRARIYVSGDNLLLLTNYTGYDPEVFTDAGLASRGIEYLNYPRPRTISTGINLTF
ncbi:MAG TPA: SusC/RagA family TonB-linked outer membrane protein [Longimicrobiaceae bacterium]|nr:SusC/RagA family TonB-linked outer membrane protein [Longimicrobiaceae bacterium]